MSLYSKTQKQEHIQLIRILMVRNPDISLRQIQNAIVRERGLELTLPYLMQLKKKVHSERIYKIESQDLKIELAKHEELVEVLANELWRIILDSSSRAGEKIHAAQTLIKAREGVIQAKMDAGIFERKVGAVRLEGMLTPEQETLIEKAISYVFPKNREQKIKVD